MKIKINGHSMSKNLLADLVYLMDDSIREEVHRQLAPCSADEFMSAYLELDPDFLDTLSRSGYEVEED